MWSWVRRAYGIRSQNWSLSSLITTSPQPWSTDARSSRCSNSFISWTTIKVVSQFTTEDAYYPAGCLESELLALHQMSWKSLRQNRRLSYQRHISSQRDLSSLSSTHARSASKDTHGTIFLNAESPQNAIMSPQFVLIAYSKLSTHRLEPDHGIN